MTHRRRCPCPGAASVHFIFRPEAAVEQDTVALARDCDQPVVDFLNRGNTKNRRACADIDDLVCDCGSCRIGIRRFHISRYFTADKKCFKGEAVSHGFGFAIFDGNRSKFFRPIERAENRIRLEYPIENARSAIEPNRLRLAKREQAGDMIELSIGKQNRVDA